jgi:hypothetical protein
MDSLGNTYAVIVYDRLNVTIGKKNIHLTVAPTPHDALRFSVVAGHLTEDWLYEIIDSVDERQRRDSARQHFSYASSISVPKHPLQILEESRRQKESKRTSSRDDDDTSSTKTYDSETAEPPSEIAWQDWKEMYETVIQTDPIVDDIIVRVVRVSRRHSVSSSDPPYVLSYLDYKKEPIIRLCNACNLPSAIITFYRISTYVNILEPPVWKYHRPLVSTQSPSIPAWAPKISIESLPMIRIPGGSYSKSYAPSSTITASTSLSKSMSNPKPVSTATATATSVFEGTTRYLFERMMGYPTSPSPRKGIAIHQPPIVFSEPRRRSVPRLSHPVEVVVHSSGSEDNV